MRLSLRFIVPLLVTLAAFAYALVPLVDKLTIQWFVRDLDLRANLIGNTVQEPLSQLLDNGTKTRITQFLTRLTQDERLHSVGYCTAQGKPVATTPLFPKEVQCDKLDVYATAAGRQLRTEKDRWHVAVAPITPDRALDSTPSALATGWLVLVHDMSFVDRRTAETREYLYYLFVGLAVLVSLITVIIAQLSWRGWMEGMRALMRGEGLLRPAGSDDPPELRPVARDLRTLLRDIESAYSSREEGQMVWTPDALRSLLHTELRDQEVIVVSNREPYLHMRDGTQIEVKRPASGVVTALEPIMRACSGTWIAHGSGTADREVVDRHDHIGVPPEAPTYQLRRVWLTEDEEAGYYYGFSNEGLWPLCHIAHVRPTFRSSDWDLYRKVNQRFARAVAQEAKTKDPIVLVQDYHFALLPRMIRELLPNATIITFWHIPWPNPESFAICPWREELLDGLLGSSILGFHTQFHVNNFVDTVDRLLEARVDRETFSVSYRGEPTAVKRYPISIEWPVAAALMNKSITYCRATIRQRYNLPSTQALGIGVERLDYTKGIEERFRAIERMLEMHPQWVGNFSFVQIAAPSRSNIEEYQGYENRVRALAEEINARFGRYGPPPIILCIEHHDAASIYEHYRAAELCFVSSLHDGMNLVAKEFVAARDDERGVLILSRFTGAARELPEALIVNPYDAEECATAMDIALTMPETEQRDRMRIMRGLLRDFNVFRWAGRMLIDASGLRRRDRLRESSSGKIPARSREVA
ncbi:MAG: trehalose-6-phosphate synthase [Phycisphaerae bacterium]|nr:trehalose-6-phosphate synthase [Gemmatimonadaceae bacterium]